MIIIIIVCMHITYLTRVELRHDVDTWVFLIVLRFFLKSLLRFFKDYLIKQRKLFQKRTTMWKTYVYIACVNAPLMRFLSENGLTLYFKLQEENFFRLSYLSFLTSPLFTQKLVKDCKGVLTDSNAYLLLKSLMFQFTDYK